MYAAATVTAAAAAAYLRILADPCVWKDIVPQCELEAQPLGSLDPRRGLLLRIEGDNCCSKPKPVDIYIETRSSW